MTRGKKECPRCNGNCACYYLGDTNAEPRFDHYQVIVDEYLLVCKRCGYEESRREDGGLSGYTENFTRCPFCNVSNEVHRSFEDTREIKKP